MGFFKDIIMLLGARKVVKTIEEDFLIQKQVEQQKEINKINQDLDNIEEEIRQIRELVKQSEKSQHEAEDQLKQIKGDIQKMIGGI